LIIDRIIYDMSAAAPSVPRRGVYR
jgi:hypothetical protein